MVAGPLCMPVCFIIAEHGFRALCALNVVGDDGDDNMPSTAMDMGTGWSTPCSDAVPEYMLAFTRGNVRVHIILPIRPGDCDLASIYEGHRLELSAMHVA